jgi:hypothetical protein
MNLEYTQVGDDYFQNFYFMNTQTFNFINLVQDNNTNETQHVFVKLEFFIIKCFKILARSQMRNDMWNTEFFVNIFGLINISAHTKNIYIYTTINVAHPCTTRTLSNLQIVQLKVTFDYGKIRTGQCDLLAISGLILWFVFKCMGQYNRTVEGSRIRTSVIKYTNRQKQQMLLKTSTAAPAFYWVAIDVYKKWGVKCVL